MPLDAEDEAIVGHLYSLDQPIVRRRHGRETGRQARNALLMHAFHREDIGAQQAAESRSLRDPDLVAQVVATPPAGWKLVVFDRMRALSAEVLVQRSADGHVQELHPSTYREHGFPV